MNAQRMKSVRTKFPSGSRRRGIVLLLVISLLALFILMGITFALVSSQYQYASKLEKEDQRVGDQPETEMEQILGQILYDTAARTSLQYHSLLRDLYGYDDQLPVSLVMGPQRPEGRDTVQGLVQGVSGNNPTNTGSNQLFTLQFTRDTASPNTALSPILNYYAGRVITFRTGAAANHSTRVVAYQPNFDASGNLVSGQLTIESIESKLAGPVQPAQGNTFVINGAPFNGSGAGFGKPTNTGVSLDAVYQQPNPNNPVGSLQDVQSALLPHYGAYARRGGPVGYAADYPVDLGGMDETWDAPDLQNMFLAMVPPRVAENPSLPIIPSFHRPELVNYWIATANTPPDRAGMSGLSGSFPATNLTPAQRDFLRTFIFRPMPWDHPSFSGSNENFSPQLTVDQLMNALMGRDAVGGAKHTWDVDNDNDGIPDSIWIDPGLPVITGKDGRRYKRLTAILIKDLDGSINVNAHGNLAQLTDVHRAEYPTTGSIVTGYTPPSSNALGLAPANANTYLPRGLGYGPAEVDLLRMFTNSPQPLTDPNAVTAVQTILYKRYESSNTNDSGTNARPGLYNTRDPLSVVKHYGIHNDYGNLQGQSANAWYFTPNWYGTPPDIWGISAISLDIGGHPIWGNAGRNGEMTDPPYEMSLGGGESNNNDSPFTPAELERLLRYHDGDAAQLPPRLMNAANGLLSSESPGIIGASHSRRNALTTISSHIPTPALTIPVELRQPLAQFTESTGMKLPGNATILDLYQARITFGLGAGAPPALIEREMRKIVPWEFFKGQKFDINRWLGDGLDFDGDSARDDPEESTTGERSWPQQVNAGLPASFQSPVGSGHAQHTNSVPFLNPGYTFPKDNLYARQLYAQHLFCLARLLLPDSFLPDVPPNYDAALNGNSALYRRLMIRRLAQWAVNCVDYRDSDSVMTAFEFDYEPFDNDGWAVDGNLNTTGNDEVQFVGGNPQVVAMNIPENRGVVWGMEHPDLLITETLAFHDRRVKDTSYGTGTNGNRLRTDPNPSMFDATLDQFRIPQGSVIVELYCPRATLWTANQLRNQKPLTSLGTVTMGVNNQGSPVYRMAFSKLSRAESIDPEHAKSPWHLVGDPNNSANHVLETASFDPANISLMPGAALNAATVDRYAYFCPAASVPAADQQRSFYISSGANPQIQPGQYAIVGPRARTYVGSQDPTSANPPPPNGSLPLWGGNSQQRIEITPTNIDVRDTNDALTSRTSSGMGADIRQPVGIICDIAGVRPYTGPPASGVQWAQAPQGWNIGLNVTEPLPYPNYNYYPEPVPMAVPSGTVADFYDDPAAPLGTFPGEPLDTDSSLVTANAGRPIADLPAGGSGPATQTATQLDSTVYLQRLADPGAVYDPIANPYITVDWATMDVTVFSGEENTDRDVPPTGGDAGNPIDPADPGPGSIYFRTRQRGYHGANPAATYNPWSPVTQNVGGVTTPAGGSSYFSVDLSNDKNGSYVATNPGPDRHTLGYLNETIDQLTNVNGYLGEPREPMPWLTWNNRPFSNPMELLCVPSSSPQRATFELSAGNGYLAPFTGQGPYGDAQGPQISPIRSPFANLLNFFHFDASNTQHQMHLCRVLDFVEVPSPYAGTERWYNPQWFGSYNSGTGQFTGVTPPGYNGSIFYRPPFNKLSRFRDPGRININTIFDEAVWEGAVGLFPGLTASTSGNIFPNAFFQSRQGYGGGVLSMNSSQPTRFGNPFRTADSADLMPNAGGMRKSQADATLLRASTGGLTPQQPLFQINSNNQQFPQWVSPPLGTGAYHDINRNPYFRYQALQKIGNIFSTHSNCFAVWITIGYFEVEEVEVNGVRWNAMTAAQKTAWPDGMRLGQEAGADSGEVTRHRAFYMIDRSIPVGFMPGSRLNTDDCVLVRRLIE